MDSTPHLSSLHRRYECPDEWYSVISQYFAGFDYANRKQPFSVCARIDALGTMSLFDVGLESAGLQDAPYSMAAQRLQRDQCYVIWQQAGTSRTRQGDRTTELQPGDWMMFDGERPVSFYVPDNSRVFTLSLPDNGRNWVSDIPLGGAMLRRSRESQIAAAIVTETLNSDGILRPQVQNSLETYLLDVIEGSFSSPVSELPRFDPATDARLRRARQFVGDRLTDPTLRPDEIGRAIGASRRSLYRLFQEIGQTPMGYVHQRRLEEAARRLRSDAATDRSVTEISYAVGFSDASHFSRMFRARYGVSPRRWMRRDSGA